MTTKIDVFPTSPGLHKYRFAVGQDSWVTHRLSQAEKDQKYNDYINQWLANRTENQNKRDRREIEYKQYIKATKTEFAEYRESYRKKRNAARLQAHLVWEALVNSAIAANGGKIPRYNRSLFGNNRTVKSKLTGTSYKEVYDSLRPRYSWKKPKPFPKFKLLHPRRVVSRVPYQHDKNRVKNFCNEYQMAEMDVGVKPHISTIFRRNLSTQETAYDFSEYFQLCIGDSNFFSAICQSIQNSSDADIECPSNVFNFENIRLSGRKRNQQLSALDAKVKKHNFNAGNFLVEANKTASMLVTTVTNLALAIKELKRAEFSRAVKALGIDDGSVSGILKSTGSGVLQFVYGWAPLFSDIKDAAEDYAAEVITKGKKSKFRVRVSKSGLFNSVVYVESLCGDNAPFTHIVTKWEVNVKVTERLVVQLGFNQELQSFLAQHHIDDPIQWIWEWCTFSFVIDWFLNVQLYLEACSAIHNEFISKVMRNKRVEITATALNHEYRTAMYSGSVTGSLGGTMRTFPVETPTLNFVYFERQPVNDFVAEKPKLRSLGNALNPKHLMSLVSLFTQLFAGTDAKAAAAQELADRKRGAIDKDILRKARVKREQAIKNPKMSVPVLPIVDLDVERTLRKAGYQNRSYKRLMRRH